MRAGWRRGREGCVPGRRVGAGSYEGGDERGCGRLEAAQFEERVEDGEGEEKEESEGEANW